jgi:uncharacterized protein
MTATHADVSTEMTEGTALHRSPRRRRRLRVLIYLAIVLVALTAVGLGGAAWYFSAQLLNVAPSQPRYSMRVLALQGRTVVLTRTGESMRSETNGLVWRGGRAVVGSVISSSATSVVRQLVGTAPGLGAETRVALDNHIYATPAALGIRYRNVKVPDALGPMPAWYVPGRSSTWVLLAHGYTSSRTEGLRPLPTLVRLGFPALAVSYRNDVGAPASPDHLYHLGATEWQDVQAGVRYALAHGAKHVVLYGFSMGGTAVETFLHRSRYAKYVRAVVLDAPVLDWGAALDLAANKRHLPGILTMVAKRIVAFRLGLSSLDSINLVKQTHDLRAPTLIFHGTGDSTVPIAESAALARARPDIVTLIRVPGAEHTESWNVDPKRYAAALARFLGHFLH